MPSVKKLKRSPDVLRWRRQAWLWMWTLALWCGISTLLLGFAPEGNSLLAAFVANILAACAMLPPLTLWAHYVSSLPSQHKAPLWKAMVTGAVVGALKGSVTHSSFSFLTDQDLSLIVLLESVIAPLVIGIWLVPLFEVVDKTLSKYAEERELLISERVHDRLVNSQEEALGGELSAFVASANARIDGSESPEQLTNLLHELAHFDVREMSHSLWQQQERGLTGFSLRSLATVTITQHRFPAFTLSAALFLSLFSFQYQVVSAWDALARTLFQTWIALLGFLLGRYIPYRGRVTGPAVFFSIPIIVAWAITDMSVAVFGQTPAVNDVVAMVALSLALIASALIFGAVQIARQTHRQIQEELDQHHARSINREVDETLALLRRRETAELLHGYVHHQLLTFALRLRQKPEESSAVLPLIKELLARLERGQLNPTSRPPLNLPNILEEIQELWDGILQVQFRLPPTEPSLTDAEFVLLETIIHELVTNAYRHGQASAISLSIESSPQVIAITAIDNGCGSAEGAPGLGTKILNAATHNSWHIASTLEGTIVTCHIRRENPKANPRTLPATALTSS